MRQHRILLLIVAAVTALTGACGNGARTNAPTSAERTSAALGDGEYCKAARAWAAHELEPRRDEDPSWLKTYWGEYLDFVATAKRTAPEAIRAPWQTYSTQIGAQTAVFEKYGYDMQAAEEKATADEKKVFEEPSEEAQAAFMEILNFEARVYGCRVLRVSCQSGTGIDGQRSASVVATALPPSHSQSRRSLGPPRPRGGASSCLEHPPLDRTG